MISEHDFQREWKRLFGTERPREETVRIARDLLDRLPFASPLRVRFGTELDEIQALVDQRGA